MKIIGLVFTLLFFTSVNSQNISKLVKEANSLYKSGKYDQSLKLCEVILLSDKADVDAMTNKASACWISSWVYKNPGYSLNSITKSLEFADKTYEIYSNLIKEYPETEKLLNGLMASITQERDDLRKKNSEIADNTVFSKLSDNKKDNFEVSNTNENLDLNKEKNSPTNNNATTNTDDKTVTLTVTGQGKTIDEAKTNALRSAIEQAFGAFISSNTTILNDRLVKDEIVSVTNGNIQKYDVMNETTLPDGSYATTLKAIVSVNKLTTFCESKGVKIEFQGGLFAMNIKQKKLAEKSEEIAIWNTLFILNPILNQSFDYKLKSSEPIEIDHSKDLFQIKFEIDCIANSNMAVVFEYLKKTLSSISLTKSEIEDFKSLNIKIYTIKIDGNEYSLRNEKSELALIAFLKEIRNIERRFIFDDGFDKNSGGEFVRNIYNKYSSYKLNRIKGFTVSSDDNNNAYWSDKVVRNDDDYSLYYSGFESLIEYKPYNGGKCPLGRYYSNDNCDSYSFVSRNPNEKIVTFLLSKNYTLNILEKIKGFKVYPNYKTSNVGIWKNGGRIFYENNQFYLIMPILDNDLAFNVESNSIQAPSFSNDSIKIKYKSVFRKIISDTSIGTGKNNTKIIYNLTTAFNNTPFKSSIDYSFNGYNDWFIPSKNEMEELVIFSQLYNLDGKGLNWNGLEKEYLTSSFKIKDEYRFGFYTIKPYRIDYNKGFGVESSESYYEQKIVFIPVRLEKK